MRGRQAPGDSCTGALWPRPRTPSPRASSQVLYPTGHDRGRILFYLPRARPWFQLAATLEALGLSPGREVTFGVTWRCGPVLYRRPGGPSRLVSRASLGFQTVQADGRGKLGGSTSLGLMRAALPSHCLVMTRGAPAPHGRAFFLLEVLR